MSRFEILGRLNRLARSKRPRVVVVDLLAHRVGEGNAR